MSDLVAITKYTKRGRELDAVPREQAGPPFGLPYHVRVYGWEFIWSEFWQKWRCPDQKTQALTKREMLILRDQGVIEPVSAGAN